LKKKHYSWSDLTNKNTPTPDVFLSNVIKEWGPESFI